MVLINNSNYNFNFINIHKMMFCDSYKMNYQSGKFFQCFVNVQINFIEMFTEIHLYLFIIFVINYIQ